MREAALASEHQEPQYAKRQNQSDAFETGATGRNVHREALRAKHHFLWVCDDAGNEETQEPLGEIKGQITSRSYCLP